PPAHEVQRHPFFWPAEQRLAFLRDASDRVEGEDRELHSPLLNALEAVAPRAIARKGGISKAPGEKGGGWNERVDGALLGNLGKYRRYNFHSVRDLLRVIRNKCNHYRELPPELQELLGPLPDGFERYFRDRFPHLLLEVYHVLLQHCAHDPIFTKYFSPIIH
ncbi:unnamed protein product, partial [Closterium sp. NIES-53]